MPDTLLVRGARVNNLKNITVEIPKNKLVVITGLSGSGKSSLAFDTIFAEGQRRYAESLSSYARQFLELQDKPDVDEISGLAPTIALDQKGLSVNPRSTVSTVTEIMDYLRLLYARAGRPVCLTCAQELTRFSPEEIVRQVQAATALAPLELFAPLLRKQTAPPDFLERLTRTDFTKLRLNGEIFSLTELLEKGLPAAPCTIEVFLATLGPIEFRDSPEQARMQILTALELGDGIITLTPQETDQQQADTLQKSRSFSTALWCATCGKTAPDLEPRLFSFNSPHGACPTCNGLGVCAQMLPELLLPNPRLTLEEGAIKVWSRIGANHSSGHLELLRQVAKKHGFAVNVPVGELSKRAREIILKGTGEELYDLQNSRRPWPGVIPELEERYRDTPSEYLRREIETYMEQTVCSVCAGARLNRAALAVRFQGKNIAEVAGLTVEEASAWFSVLNKILQAVAPGNSPPAIAGDFTLTESERAVALPLAKEILTRLQHLKNVGLEYLTLERSTLSLSGGEAQRVRLAVQLSTLLSGVIFVLDEPTVGLHERDTAMLLKILKQLQAAGNSILVVEHDREMMKQADYLIDMGPGAGLQGGNVVAAGTPSEIMRLTRSLTGQYLKGIRKIHPPAPSHKGNGKTLTIKGASAFNLKNINVKIPLGKFVCVSGVSGSGKSTLILDILAQALQKKLYGARATPGAHQTILGLDQLDKAIIVDQAPIGRTPRSNPATYTGIFTIIRDLYTEIPEAKLKGFDAGTFSFNVRGGRCETCAGEGYLRIPMQFMPETYVVCSECKGKRYCRAALEITYRGKNIAEILEMSACEAREFFKAVPLLEEKLGVLEDVGLGYIKLGQPAPHLSGGEAQRVKLATELSRRATGKTLYILDEPTTGLHFEDIQHLLVVLERLVAKGNTVLVIEHHLDVLKCADWIIDLGPEGGKQGGEIVAEGTPCEISKVKHSYTGQALKKVLRA